MADSSAESMNSKDQILANAYDFDDNGNDFITQTSPNPQNSNSPIEPRDDDSLVPDVISLSSQDIGISSVELTWDAPTNANTGEGAYYDARYALKNEDCDLQINWSSAAQISNLPTPAASVGQEQSVSISNLLDGTEYCFAIKVFKIKKSRLWLCRIKTLALQNQDSGFAKSRF